MQKMRLLALLMITAGGGLIAFGVYIELTVRTQRGSGLKRFFGNIFYSGEIDSYRTMAFHALFYAPALLILGFGMWTLVSWRQRNRQEKQLQQDLMKLKPAARKNLLSRGLSQRKLANELERLKK